MSDAADDHIPGDDVFITVPADMQAGVWANWGAISESDHEFTIDFARIDHSVDPNVGVMVARVGISPRMLRQLLDRLDESWEAFTDQLAEDLRDDPGAPPDSDSRS